MNFFFLNYYVEMTHILLRLKKPVFLHYEEESYLYDDPSVYKQAFQPKWNFLYSLICVFKDMECESPSSLENWNKKNWKQEISVKYSDKTC